MSRRCVTLLLMTGFVVLFHPTRAHACACIAARTFESKALTAPLLVAVRIVGTRPVDRPGADSPDNIAAIDVEVMQVLRGKETRPRLLIWDQFAGGSCSLELYKLTVGTLAVIAIDPDEERLTESRSVMGIEPDSRGYVLGTCGNPIRTFRDEEALREYVDSAHWRPKQAVTIEIRNRSSAGLVLVDGV